MTFLNRAFGTPLYLICCLACGSTAGEGNAPLDVSGSAPDGESGSAQEVPARLTPPAAPTETVMATQDTSPVPTPLDPANKGSESSPPLGSATVPSPTPVSTTSVSVPAGVHLEESDAILIDVPEPVVKAEGNCGVAEAEAELTARPIDIIIVIDNSASMKEEIKGVEHNINANFANILQGSGLDYRVIVVSRHGDSDRNVICVEAPLSGAASCSPPPPTPVFTERFFQYDGKIRSNDAFTKLLVMYMRDGTVNDENRDYSRLSLTGWNEYVRLGSKKVFLILTDDEAEGMTWQEFDTALRALDSEQFGSDARRNFVWHSIVGVAAKPNPAEAYQPEEPVELATCSADVESAAPQYQELSKATGGLRFPLCNPDSYDVVFKSIATDVIAHAELECDFPIPAPPAGRDLDLNKVAVGYTPAAGVAEQTFAQAPDLATCQAGAFYIANNQISLCPQTCADLQDNPQAQVKVLFTCEPTLLVIQ